MIHAVWLLIGMATMYAEPYIGGPLYCCRDGTLLYTPRAEAWVAIDVLLYQQQGWQCNDELEIRLDGGHTFQARALDAGPLYRYYIADRPDLPLLIDVPVYYWPFTDGRLSSPVTVLNRSLLKREFERRAGR